MAHDVFISYASPDKPTADAVCARLESRRIRCWIAPRDVLPGMDYGQALVEAIKQSRLVVLVFSGRSNDSPQVKREIERAVANGITVLPFRIEDVAPSSSLEYFIAGSHWLDALTPPLERHLDRLAETAELLLSRADAREAVRSEQAPIGREPVSVSPALVAVDAAIRKLRRFGRLSALSVWRVLRSGATAAARHPRTAAIAGVGVCGVILVAILLMMLSSSRNGNGNEQVRQIPPPSQSAIPANVGTLTEGTTSSPTASKRTATPGSAQNAAAIASAVPMGQSDKDAIVASPTCVAPGGRVEATWTAVDQKPGDVIALFPASAQDTEYASYKWQYVQTTGGNAVFPAPSTPGDYEVRLVRDSIHLAASNPVTVKDGCPSLSAPAQIDGYSATASPTCVAPGGRVEATWTAVDQKPGDVIALFPASAQDTEYASYKWQYVQTTGGNAVFPAPSTPGDYEVRLVRDSIHLAASNPVTVKDGCPSLSAPAQIDGYSATASPTCVAPGGRVEATWTAVDQKPGDVIALFPASAQDTEYASYKWQYVQTTGGNAVFPAPSTPGDYEVRLVRDSIHLAASNPVTVSDSCPP